MSFYLRNRSQGTIDQLKTIRGEFASSSNQGSLRGFFRPCQGHKRPKSKVEAENIIFCQRFNA